MGGLFKGCGQKAAIIALSVVIAVTVIRFRSIQRLDTFVLTTSDQPFFVRSIDDWIVLSHRIKWPPNQKISNITGKWYWETEPSYEDRDLIWCPYFLIHAFAAVVYACLVIRFPQVKTTVKPRASTQDAASQSN